MAPQEPTAADAVDRRLAATRRADGRLVKTEVASLLAELADGDRGWRDLELVPVDAFLDLGEALLREAPEEKRLLHDWLDATRRSPFLRRLNGTAQGERWLGLVENACRTTGFTVGALFRHRVDRGPGRLWLRVLCKGSIEDLTLEDVAARVDAIARGLHSLFPASPSGQPVALLAENSPATIFADMACLTSGLVNTTIPADATAEQAAYILEQVEAQVLFVGSDRQLEKMAPVLAGLPRLRWVVQIGGPVSGDPPGAARDGAVESGRRPTDRSTIGARRLTLEQLIARGGDLDEAEFRARRDAPGFDDAATIMYTSGTTGMPKGIVFTHRNIVFKRFARALALPEIGETDRFLCYLPLYHTFGRWLEMTGSLFWGASYAFMESPALETMLENLRRTSPSVFISIPKKWIQLHDHIRQIAPELTDARQVRAAVEEVTGGRLRWGLSAAGYLDPAVFRFFQRNGVELMSGFGMTEATGGITMTPPGDYREGTVGVALPGIEIHRAEDGELLVRGPYVMQSYFGPDEARVDHREDWFHTGDIVSIDEDGFVAIVDRKKDIYKNVKGQTVAPQRVESFFQSFGEIQQVFLVGDGREYNTLLIYPNLDHLSPPLAEMPEEELREYLSSIVVSVNGFLAPYERVLDFAILPRPLSLEQEELTPKGTFRRKVVEEHFTDLIAGMYEARASRWRAADLDVRIPHWLLRDMGLTLRDVEPSADGLRLPRLGRSLAIAREDGRLRVGDLYYRSEGSTVDLEAILRAPELWIGNAALVEFTGPAGMRRPQRRREIEGGLELRVDGIARLPRLTREEQQRLRDALWREDRSLQTLHWTAVALLTANGRDGLRLIGYLEQLAGEEDSQRAELARIALRRLVGHPRRAIRSAAFRTLLPHGEPSMVTPTLLNFLHGDPGVLNRAGAEALSRRGLPDEVMAAVLGFTAQVYAAREAVPRDELDRLGSGDSRPAFGGFDGDAGADLLDGDPDEPAAAPLAGVAAAPPAGSMAAPSANTTALPEAETLALLRFLVVYAHDHPGWFVHVRQELTRWMLSSETPRIRDYARRGLERLVHSFRRWLGPDPRVAIDPVTGREYGWAQVLRFDPGLDPRDRRRLEEAISTAPLVKEAIFILFGGARVSLTEIPAGGIRIRLLGTRHEKSVYRLSVQTRQSGSYEIALNLLQEMRPQAAEEEFLWLTRLGSPSGGRPLVEDVGGWWPEYRLWTEEFVSGETISTLLERLTRSGLEEDGEDWLLTLWIHLASSAAATYVDFWNRTGRTLVPGDPSPQNLIVPAHDYQEGSRIVSLSERQPYRNLAAFLRSLKEGILDRVGERIPRLEGMASTEPLFSAVLDGVGEEEGASLLASLLEDPETLDRELPGEEERLRLFLDRVRAGGYMPRRLAAAIRRFHRWYSANATATPEARARTLRDLWESYALRDLELARPETRIRLFRETVFSGARESLREELAALIDAARAGRLSFEALLREMSEWVRRMRLSEEELYFLARMTYAHLRPAETADLAMVEQGGTRISDLVVTRRDHAGRYFRVRHASSPREVWSLHQLFYGSGIQIRFRPGHQFLVAVDENNKVLGGLVYRFQDRVLVHMEKIVVAPSHRRQGISEELMEDFFQRLRDRGVRAVTTGFFRPQYFRRFHFQIDREHAGLVRILEEPAAVRPRGEDGESEA